MKYGTDIQHIIVNRVVIAIFVLLIGFYSLANTVIEPFGKPLEPVAEALYAGFWMFRTEFLMGGFLTALVLMWIWFFIYTYFLAVMITLSYRGINHIMDFRRDNIQ